MDSCGEPEAAAGWAGDGDDIFVPAVRGGFAKGHGVEGWGFDLVAGVGGAGAEFDGDFVRGELAEEDGGDEAEGIAGVEGAEVAIRLRGVDADVVPCGVEAETLSVEGDGGAAGVGHEAAVVVRGWDVEFVAVFCDHASGGEEAEAHADGGFHHGDPAGGVAAAGAGVEERGDVVFEHAVEGGGFDGVAVFIVFVFLAIADGPAAVGGVALAPPAVEDGDIETAVDGGFHAGGAAGFHAAAWGVEPDVGSLDEGAGEAHVVVFEEEEAVADSGAAGDVDDLADEVLAVVVCGVGFACEDELDWAVLAAEESLETFGVAEEEGGAFVAGGAACEADGEDVRVEDAAGGGEFGAGGVACGELARHGVAGGAEETAAGHFVSAPEFLVGDVVDAGEVARVEGGFFPICAEERLEESEDFRGDPCGGVDAVSDVLDGDLVAEVVREDVLPHAAGDIAVESGDGVRALGHAEPEDGHGEWTVLVAGGAAPFDDAPWGDAGFGFEGLHVFLDEGDWEGFVAGGDGGVGGEDIGARGDLAGGVDVETLVFGEEFETGDAEEGGVAFVHVADFWFHAHGDEGAEAADGEEEFLAEPHEVVTAVETGGEVAVVRRVFAEVSVHEEEGDAADLEVPDPEVADAVGEGDGDVDGFAGWVAGEAHGEVFDFVELIVFLLPAVVVEFLFEVALVVEEADAAEIDADVGGGLEVIAGEDAETAAVEFDAFVEAELEGEVGDEPVEPEGIGSGAFAEAGFEASELGLEADVFGEGFEGGAGDPAEEFERAAGAIAPESGVDAAEELLGFGVPAPPCVAGEFLEEADLLWDARGDVDDLDVLHEMGWREA